MRKRFFLAVTWLWAQSHWPGRILFEFQPEYSLTKLPPELIELQSQLRGSIRERFPGLPSKSPIYVLEYTAPLAPDYVAKLWRRSPAVRYAEPEYLPRAFGSPLPPHPEKTTYTPNDLHPQNYCLTHLRVLGAWDSTQGDTTVAIGIVDTDVRFDHPDLVDNIAYNWNDPINGIDDDNDGYVDNFHGWDIVGTSYSGSGNFSPDNDPRTSSPGHGTFVAGYAGATTDNGIGIAAPAFKCRILPIKAAPDNSSALYGAYDGVLYAATHGAKVINCSWGSTSYSQAAQSFLQNLVDTYDPVVVAAAGNVPPDTPAVFYPAQYPGVVSVTAVDTSDVWRGTVQIGYGIDLSTTGAGITTTGLNGYFSFGTATSFAAPQASGCAALLRAWRPDLNAYQIAELLRITADSVEPANPPHLRYRLGRRINLYRAITTRDTPACRVTSYTAYDSNDTLFFAGETFFLTATYKNFLSPVNNLTVTVEPLSPHLQVISGQGAYSIGSLGTLQAHIQPSSGAFAFQVLPSCPPNATVPILFRFQGGGGYSDYQVIELKGLNPAFAHLDSAQLRTTLCGNGRVGYYDTPTNTQGRGGRWQNNPSWLFEGGLVIADDTSAHLCTRAPLGGMYNHFTPTQAATKAIQGLYESAEVSFLVTGGITTPKPLTIKAQAYAPRREPLNTFVAFIYQVENYGGSAYNDLSVGWWLDFDVSNNPTTDQAAKHSSLPLVYARNNTGTRFIGAVLLSGQTALLQVGRADTFTAAPTSYIGLFRQGNSTTATTGDVFVAISAQGINLPAGSKDTVAFALIGGNTLSELLDNAQAAIDWYACFIAGQTPTVDLGPDRALCLGDTLAAQGAAGTLYLWSTGATTSTIAPTQSGLYWLMLQNSQGCWGYDEVFLTINALAAAQVTFLPGQTISVGTTLQGIEQSNNPYQYTWQVETPTGWQTFTGSSFSYTYTTAGTYTVKLHRTDPNTGCSDSLSWQITVTSTSGLPLAAQEVRVYPNPSTGTLLIEHNQLVGTRVRLRDALGKVVWESTLFPSGALYRLPAGLAPGLYFWEIGNHQGHLLYMP